MNTRWLISGKILRDDLDKRRRTNWTKHAWLAIYWAIVISLRTHSRQTSDRLTWENNRRRSQLKMKWAKSAMNLLYSTLLQDYCHLMVNNMNWMTRKVVNISHHLKEESATCRIKDPRSLSSNKNWISSSTFHKRTIRTKSSVTPIRQTKTESS